MIGIVATLILLIIFDEHYSRTTYDPLTRMDRQKFSPVMPAMAVAFLTLVAGVLFLKVKYRVPANPDSRRTPNLRHTEETIKFRLDEIERQRVRVREALFRVRKAGGDHLEAVRESLSGALKGLENHRARYTLKQMGIDLVRRLNRLAPLVHHIDGCTFEETQAGLKVSDGAILRGTKMLSELDVQRQDADVPSEGYIIIVEGYLTWPIRRAE